MMRVSRIGIFVVVLICIGVGDVRLALSADQVMRERVYAKLSRSQVATEAEDWDRAYDLLAQVAKMEDLTPGEKAQLYSAYGYTYFTQERYAESVAAYEQVLRQEDLVEALRTGTLYTLGQLQLHLEHYDQAVGHLEAWLQVVENPGPDSHILLGQAYYRLGRLENAAESVKRAIAAAEGRGRQVPENWFALLRAIYYEAEDYENLLDVLNVMVTRYRAKEYWLHLSSTYGETGDLERQLAVYEMAYTQGYLTSSAEIVLLSQLLLQADIPYRAGVLLQEGLESGSVDSTAGNWRLLSQAWIRAHEHDAAIITLGRAAELSDDGEFYARIAQSYANLNRWELSADAASMALDRGVENPHELHLTRGMALYELGRFTEAEAAFSRAQRSEGGRESASRWLAHLQRERGRLRELGVGSTEKAGN
ncbi:MAG: tetratricopeptide repeat protein [bacterium]|nr:tetratricopeptide repeat protein [bacterium]